MSGDKHKTLKIKMRGPARSGKTNFLLAIAAAAQKLGMQVVVADDLHNMTITSTAPQRRALWELNHRKGIARSADPDE